MTTLWNQKLKQHPYQLVSTIALIDATYFLIFNTLDEVCTLNLYKLYSYTVFFSSSPDKMHDSLRLILNCSLYLFKTLFIISFFLNSFLCIDLYLTVKSPFTPASSRCKVYYCISFLTGIIVSWIEASRFNMKGSTEE